MIDEQRIEAEAVVDEGQLGGRFIVEVEHGVHGSAEAAAEDGGGEALAGVEVEGEGVDVAGFVEDAVDGDGEGLESFDFGDFVVGFGFGDFILIADDEDARGGCAFGVIEADEVGAGGTGVADFEDEGAVGGAGIDFDLG